MPKISDRINRMDRIEEAPEEAYDCVAKSLVWR